MNSNMRKTYLFILVSSLVFVVIGLILFSSTGRDDSYLTFWSAHTLSSYGEIVNYNGEKVEQSSTLAFVLLLAIADKVSSISLPNMGFILSILFFITSILLSQRLANIINPNLPLKGTSLIVGSSPYLLYWSLSGSETTFIASMSAGLLISYSAFLKNKGKKVSFILFAVTIIFLLSRPESIFILICTLVGTIVFLKITEEGSLIKDSYNKILILLALVIVCFLLVVAFRYFYFGDIFPQPVSAKIKGISYYRIRDGLYYAALSWRKPYMIITGAIFLLGTIHTFNLIKKKVNISISELLSLSFVLSYVSFTIFCGGDWMEGGRFYVFILPIITIFAVHYLSRIIKNNKKLNTMLILLFFIHIAGIFAFANDYSSGRPIWTVPAVTEKLNEKIKTSDFSLFNKANRVHLRYIVITEKLNEIINDIKLYKSEKITIMTRQMGQVPYYIAKEHFGYVEFIDACALSTRDLSSCPVTKNLKSFFGSCLPSYKFYFENKEDLYTCGIKSPDIIYDPLPDVKDKDKIEKSEFAALVKNGYTIFYKIYGVVPTHSKIKGRRVISDHFIAVRNDLVKYIKDDPQIYEWDI